jgi:anti-sigma factor RsiW
MSAHADSFSLWDAAYVLGALSPAERRDFEEHLAGCASCQRSVAELAGLPGLLGQVSPEDAAMLAAEAQPAEGEAAPTTLMTRVIGEQRTRRRRIVAAVAGAAVALILILGGVAAGAGLLRPRPPFLLAFSEVQPTAITAIVEVMPVSEGTDFQVECQYGEANEPTPGGGYETYEIWIVDRSGTAVEAKAWPAHPGRVMRPQAHSPWKVTRISAVEIRSSEGETLLRADLR